MSELSVPTPAQFRHLRACLVCSIVQMHARFRKEGCPNCEPFLDLAGHEDTIQECTSSHFSSVIAIVDPQNSFVARWQRLDNFVPGSYALKVAGVLPKDYADSMTSQGIQFFPRDGSLADEFYQN